MRQGIGLTLLVFAIAAAFVLGRAQAQDDGKNDAMEAMKKAWEELGKPGPEQESLAKHVGNWTVHAKEFKPDGTVSETKSTTKFSMVLDGRILRQDYEGKMAGTPFTGIGFTGYDKGSGKYQSVWMDSMSTGMMFSIGTKLEDGRIEYKGHFFGPNAMKVPCRIVMAYPDADTQTMEFHMAMGGADMKSMEMTYKRVK